MSTHRGFLIEHLLPELLLNILDYVTDESKICFAAMNKATAFSLIRKVGKFRLRTQDLEDMDREMWKKFFSLFEFPYFQFSLVDNSSRKSAYVPPLSAVHIVETTNIALVRQLARVYELRVFSNTEKELSSLLHVLFLKAKLTNLGMKSLKIIEGHQLTEIPVFQGLESLHLLYFRKLQADGLQPSLYTKLRTLTLEYCETLEDVACLDGIYDLRLLYCHNIRDISRLNNNRRVTIWGCSGIIDYSKSFQQTKKLNVMTNSKLPTISLTCESLKFLSIEGSFVNISNFTSLLFLSMERITGLYSLPPNRLQKVRIADCIDFHSFENMGNIQTIELRCLQSISTLQGLGHNNWVVRLESLPHLTDISSLKDAKRVEIRDCPRVVNTVNTLKNVHAIKLCSASLIYHASSKKVADIFEPMKELTNLKELELIFQARVTQIGMISGNFLHDLWRLLRSSSWIQRVVIYNEKFPKEIIDPQLHEDFLIELSLPKQIVLLRKNDP